MAVIRMQCSFGADTAFPRDRFVITPHFRTSFNATIGGANEQALVDDLAAALSGWAAGSGREVVVRAYDAESAPPNVPLASAILNVNGFVPSTIARELAVCLSFFSDRNSPRYRGRLYLPAAILTTTDSAGLHPSGNITAKAQALVPILTDLGGADIDWCVYSRSDGEARPVTNWWIDNEWDMQRRRGYRATGRAAGTTDEAGTPVTP